MLPDADIQANLQALYPSNTTKAVVGLCHLRDGGKEAYIVRGGGSRAEIVASSGKCDYVDDALKKTFELCYGPALRQVAGRQPDTRVLEARERRICFSRRGGGKGSIGL